VPALSEPVDDVQLDCTDQVTLRWSAVDDESAVSYDWQLQEGKAETNGDINYVSRSSKNTEETSAQLTDMVCGAQYRWRVRAVDEVGNESDFSEYALFTILPPATPTPTPDEEAPDPPGPILPTDDSEFACGESVELTWSDVDDPSGIDRYEWEVEQSTEGRNGSFSFTRAGNAIDPAVTLSDLDCPSDVETIWYRWHVRAVDNEENESDFFSPAAYFKMVRQDE
jgi:predicted phage tail protein